MTRDYQQPYSLGSGQQDRLGVIFTDDFEVATPYEVTGNAGDFGSQIYVKGKMFGQKGRMLTTRITDPVEGDWIKISKILNYPKSGRCVLRFRLGLPDVSTIYKIYITVKVVDGVTENVARISYWPLGKKLMYLSSLGDEKEIKGYDFTITDGLWSIFEMSIDTEMKEFLEVMLFGKRTRMSGLRMRYTEDKQDRRIEISLMVSSIGAKAAVIYMDSLYVGEFDKL